MNAEQAAKLKAGDKLRKLTIKDCIPVTVLFNKGNAITYEWSGSDPVIATRKHHDLEAFELVIDIEGFEI